MLSSRDRDTHPQHCTALHRLACSLRPLFLKSPTLVAAVHIHCSESSPAPASWGSSPRPPPLSNPSAPRNHPCQLNAHPSPIPSTNQHQLVSASSSRVVISTATNSRRSKGSAVACRPGSQQSVLVATAYLIFGSSHQLRSQPLLHHCVSIVLTTGLVSSRHSVPLQPLRVETTSTRRGAPDPSPPPGPCLASLALRPTKNTPPPSPNCDPALESGSEV